MATCQYPDCIRENLLKFCCICHWNNEIILFQYVFHTSCSFSQVMVIKWLTWVIAFPSMSVSNKHKNLEMASIIMAWLLVGKYVHKSTIYQKAILCQGNTVVNNICVFFDLAFRIACRLKIGRLRKRKLRICFKLIHWMLY